MKLILRGILAIFGIGFAIIIFVGINILSGYSSLKPIRSDCIIILGCSVYGTVPSPFLTARIEEGLRLYNEGYGKYIIVSGGQGINEEISEAEAMKRYLLSKGMDPSRIIKEDKSRDTMQNLTNSKKIMNQMNFKSAVIVSNKFHLKRSLLIAKEIGIEASSSGVFVARHRFQEYLGFAREILATLKFYIVNK